MPAPFFAIPGLSVIINVLLMLFFPLTLAIDLLSSGDKYRIWHFSKLFNPENCLTLSAWFPVFLFLGLSIRNATIGIILFRMDDADQLSALHHCRSLSCPIFKMLLIIEYSVMLEKEKSGKYNLNQSIPYIYIFCKPIHLRRCK